MATGNERPARTSRRRRSHREAGRQSTRRYCCACGQGRQQVCRCRDRRRRGDAEIRHRPAGCARDPDRRPDRARLPVQQAAHPASGTPAAAGLGAMEHCTTPDPGRRLSLLRGRGKNLACAHASQGAGSTAGRNARRRPSRGAACQRRNQDGLHPVRRNHDDRPGGLRQRQYLDTRRRARACRCDDNSPGLWRRCTSRQSGRLRSALEQFGPAGGDARVWARARRRHADSAHGDLDCRDGGDALGWRGHRDPRLARAASVLALRHHQGDRVLGVGRRRVRCHRVARGRPVRWRCRARARYDF